MWSVFAHSEAGEGLWQTNLVIGHQLRPQDPVIRVMRLFVGESVEHHGCDVGCAHERDSAVGAGGVDFALVFDGCEVPAFGKVFWGILVELHEVEQTKEREKSSTSLRLWLTHKPSRLQNTVLHLQIQQMLPHFPNMPPTGLRRATGHQNESLDPMLLVRQVDELVHAWRRVCGRWWCKEIDGGDLLAIGKRM